MARRIKPGTYDPVAKFEVSRYEGLDWVIETYPIPAKWVTGNNPPAGEYSHFIVMRTKQVLEKDWREIILDPDEFEALAKLFKKEAKVNRKRVWKVKHHPVPEQRPGTVLE